LEDKKVESFAEVGRSKKKPHIRMAYRDIWQSLMRQGRPETNRKTGGGGKKEWCLCHKTPKETGANKNGGKNWGSVGAQKEKAVGATAGAWVAQIQNLRAS